MLGLKLIHVSKMGPRWNTISTANLDNRQWTKTMVILYKKGVIKKPNTQNLVLKSNHMDCDVITMNK